MRNYLANYTMIHCNSLAEALQLMSQPNPPIPFAGGTDLMVYLNFKKLPEGKYLDLQNIPELQKIIKINENEIVLSARTTYMDVRLHPFFQNKLSMLVQASMSVGAMGIQTRGTWAGNIANASPAADGVPALMAYDAQVVLLSEKGERKIHLSEFYQGYKKTVRATNEIIKEICIPISETNGFSYYRKVGERKAQAISKVLLAGRIVLNAEGVVQKSRFIFGSVMPYTYRMKSLENLLANQSIQTELVQKAIEIVGQEIQPIDDIRSTSLYRRQVAQNLTEEFLHQTMEKFRVSTAETRRIHIG